MLKLLLKLLVLPPELLQMHAQGYADLASQAWANHLCALKNRWVLYSLSALSLLLALIFAGVGLLLWSVLQLTDAPHPWVLLGLPLSLLAVSAVCWAWGRSLRSRPILGDIKAQIQLDMMTIRQAQMP